RARLPAHEADRAGRRVAFSSGAQPNYRCVPEKEARAARRPTRDGRRRRIAGARRSAAVARCRAGRRVCAVGARRRTRRGARRTAARTTRGVRGTRNRRTRLPGSGRRDGRERQHAPLTQALCRGAFETAPARRLRGIELEVQETGNSAERRRRAMLPMDPKKKTERIVKMIMAILILFPLIAFVMGEIVLHLWNWLMP